MRAWIGEPARGTRPSRGSDMFRHSKRLRTVRTVRSRPAAANCSRRHARHSLAGLLHAAVVLRRRPMEIHQRDLEKKRDLQLEELVSQRNTLGENHPQTLAAAASLAMTLAKLGDVDEARRIQTQVLRGWKKRVVSDTPDVLVSKKHLTEAMLDLAIDLGRRSLSEALGDLVAARYLAEEIFMVQTKSLGESHRDTLRAKTDLGFVIHEIRATLRTLRDDINRGFWLTQDRDHVEDWALDHAGAQQDLGYRMRKTIRRVSEALHGHPPHRLPIIPPRHP